MKKFLLFSFIFLLAGCAPQEEFDPNKYGRKVEPAPNSHREFLEELSKTGQTTQCNGYSVCTCITQGGLSEEEINFVNFLKMQGDNNDIIRKKFLKYREEEKLERETKRKIITECNGYSVCTCIKE